MLSSGFGTVSALACARGRTHIRTRTHTCTHTHIRVRCDMQPGSARHGRHCRRSHLKLGPRDDAVPIRVHQFDHLVDGRIIAWDLGRLHSDQDIGGRREGGRRVACECAFLSPAAPYIYGVLRAQWARGARRRRAMHCKTHSLLRSTVYIHAYMSHACAHNQARTAVYACTRA